METIQERIEDIDSKVNQFKRENSTNYFICTLTSLLSVLSVVVLSTQVLCFVLFLIGSCEMIKEIEIKKNSIKFLEKEKNYLLNESKDLNGNVLVNCNNNNDNQISNEIKSIYLQKFFYLITILSSSLVVLNNILWLGPLLMFLKLYLDNDIRELELNKEISNNNYLLNKSLYDYAVNNNKKSSVSSSLNEKDVEYCQQISINSISDENERLIDDYVNSLDGIGSKDKSTQKVKKKD